MSLIAPKYASDHIHSIAYDDETGSLVIRFHKGGTFAYEGVDASTYERLLNAPSAGGFFRSEIKGRYPHRKV